MSLYRKYRPQDFDQLIGQDHVKKTLSQAVRLGRISHAYLFSGTRGTGKTSSARILAKAINCLQPKNGQPCNKCQNCLDFNNNRSLDLIEIDAASNRGIDEIRNIIEKVKFAPAKAKYKVFVIDEAHMLTKEAFNALLKTLEEPPSHAVFVLATTEPHKLPPTILSRVQRFDFKRVRPSEIAQKLSEIAKKEKIKIEEDAILAIAEAADGSFRDGESILDQAISYVGKDIKVKDLEQILGITDQKVIINFLDFLIANDAKGSIIYINDLSDRGTDLSTFVDNLVEYLRKMLLAKNKALPAKNIFIDFNKAQEQLDAISIGRLVDFIKYFVEARREIKSSSLPQLPLELAITELYLRKVQSEETQVKAEDEKKLYYEKPKKNMPEIKETKQKEDKKDNKSDKIVKKMVDIGNIYQLLDIWPNLLRSASGLNHSLVTLLRSCLPVEIGKDKIKLAAHFKFHQDQINKVERRKTISEIIKKLTGQDYRIECVSADEIDEKVINQIKDKISKVDRKTEEDLEKSVTEVFG